MIKKLVWHLLLCVTAATIVFTGQALGNSPLKDEVIQRASSFEQKGHLTIRAHTLHAADLTLRLYKENDYRPLWKMKTAKSLYYAVDDLTLDGLNPEDYRFADAEPLLMALAEGKLSAAEQVDLDFLLTESFARAIYNLGFGKVDPVSLDPDFNYTRPLPETDVAPVLLKYITEGKINAAFDHWRPQNKRYGWMKQALAQYRQYQESGGWAAIPDGEPMKPGDSTPRVVSLRERLRITGDYPADAPAGDNPAHYDDALEDAVKRFQQRHGLAADGKVGKATLAALNLPVEDRVDQIRVNLERQRWVMHEVTDELLVADIAGFTLLWGKDNKVIWQEKIQVGKHYTKTPLFKGNIQFIVFNPTWTIPPGILKRSILPNLKKDPDYLDKKGFLLLTRDGNRVDPKTVDWSSIDGFPYMVRQPPGPDNALGLVKFMFPNPHYVFLHDTNHRELFDRTSRTFSSGCVRLDNPLDLAERLLADQPEWTRERIDQVIASGETTTVHLKTPMRIVIAYGTVAVREDGVIRFREDVYKRDPAVLGGLDSKFKLRKQDD